MTKFDIFLKAEFSPDVQYDLTTRRLISLHDNPNVMFNTQTIKFQDDLVDTISGVNRQRDLNYQWEKQLEHNRELVGKLRQKGFNKLADQEDKRLAKLK